MGILTTLKTWLAVAGAFVLALAGASVYWFIKGRNSAQDDDEADAMRQVMHSQEVRHDVQTKIDKMPDRGTQKVSEADPDTSAGVLRDRWMRDRDAKD